MTTENFKILFVQAKNRTNKSNQSPIYCRLTFRNERKQFSTGINIEEKHWDAKLQTIDKKHSQAIQYNRLLENIKSKLLTSILLCTSTNPDCNADDIYNQFLGKVEKKKIRIQKIKTCTVRDSVSRESFTGKSARNSGLFVVVILKKAVR